MQRIYNRRLIVLWCFYFLTIHTSEQQKNRINSQNFETQYYSLSKKSVLYEEYRENRKRMLREKLAPYPHVFFKKYSKVPSNLDFFLGIVAADDELDHAECKKIIEGNTQLYGKTYVKLPYNEVISLNAFKKIDEKINKLINDTVHNTLPSKESIFGISESIEKVFSDDRYSTYARANALSRSNLISHELFLPLICMLRHAGIKMQEAL